MNNQTLSINAGAFVIPNGGWTVGHFKNNGIGDTYEYLVKMTSLNGITLEDDDKVVQLWLHSKEVDCDNINDHGFLTQLDGREIFVRAYKLQWVPIKMLDGIKEGDCVEFLSPATAYTERKSFKLDKNSDRFDITLKVSMICQQQGFRYARFGKFEEVVKMVIK